MNPFITTGLKALGRTAVDASTLLHPAGAAFLGAQHGLYDVAKTTAQGMKPVLGNMLSKAKNFAGTMGAALPKMASDSRLDPGATNAIGMKRTTPGFKGIHASKLAAFKKEIETLTNTNKLHIFNAGELTHGID